MGKVKSAIITALLVAAVIVLALFATISCNVPGSNGVKRYNSFISSIRLGGDLTGEATTTLYPQGVISAADYNVTEGKQKEKYVQHGGLYVEADKLEDNGGEALKNSVLSDAEILSARFGEKAYTSYSVAVEDDFAIKVSVPTGFSYAAYGKNNATERSNALSDIEHTVSYLMLDGKLSLRSTSDYKTSKPLISVTEDINTYFKKISKYSMGGTHALRITLTNEGFDKLNEVIKSSTTDDSTAYFFVGETSLNLTVQLGEENMLTEKTIYYTASSSYAQDYAILLKSVVSGVTLANRYNDDVANSGTTIVAESAAFGNYAAVYLLGAVLIAIVAAILVSVIKYKLLGLVNSLMVLIYSLAMLTAILLLNIQLTVAGAFMALVGLALLTFTNFRVFEEVRKQSLTGRTIQASVKDGYKKTIMTVMDLHIVLLVISLLMTLLGAGELAACGFIFFIATIASYLLYWFTRFMWFVISSPVRDKFKFCGFSREAYDNED